jgi:hypothetical protein
LYYCNRKAAILPTALVGTVLLTQYERGIPMGKLVCLCARACECVYVTDTRAQAGRVAWLRDEIVARGYNVTSVDGASPLDAIRTVVEQVMSRDHEAQGNGLVKRHKSLLLLSLYSPKERMELTLLRNSLLHVFVDEALVCCSMYAVEVSVVLCL